MRLTLLAAGFVVGSVAVTTGVAVDSLTLVALGIVVAVLTGALLKPEFGKQRYAARVERSNGACVSSVDTYKTEFRWPWRVE